MRRWRVTASILSATTTAAISTRIANTNLILPIKRKLVITGAEGLIGWHLRCFYHGLADQVDVVPLNHAAFDDNALLDAALTDCDGVAHLAGLNRGKPEEVAAGNIAIAARLVARLEKTAATPHVVFSSSTQIDQGNSYGDSKKACGDRLAEWATNGGGTFTNLILPHVFGEYGRPFYNSVVSTFCHQLANGEQPQIDNDSELQLLHCHDVSQWIERCFSENLSGDQRPSGESIMVSELLSLLQDLAAIYFTEKKIPQLSDALTLRLFNTLRSQLPAEARKVALTRHADERGSLFEVVRSHNEGQTFFSTTNPGITRGDHYHFHKVERFLVAVGKATIRMRRLFTDEVLTYEVSGDEPTYVDMPTLFTHLITNAGDDELLTLFWANEIFDPENPDTIAEPVDR